MELASNPTFFIFFGPSQIITLFYKFWKLKCNGHKKQPLPKMYTIDTLKESKIYLCVSGCF